MEDHTAPDGISATYSLANGALNAAVGILASQPWPIDLPWVLSELASLLAGSGELDADRKCILAAGFGVMTETALARAIGLPRNREMVDPLVAVLGGPQQATAQFAGQWLRSKDDSSPYVRLFSAALDGHAVGGPRLRELADQGNLLAMVLLGRLLQDGLGTGKNPIEAATWYRRAADAGDACGAFNLARLFQAGSGVQKDEVEALRWYVTSAEAGLAIGMTLVGRSHEYGFGTPRNLAQAFFWYRRAAEAGNTAGAHLLYKLVDLCWTYFTAGKGFGHFSVKAVDDLIALVGVRDPAEHARWVRRAAEAGDCEAAFSYGMMLQQGYGVAKDEVESVHWTRQAADDRHYRAMGELYAHYAAGFGGLKKDAAESAAWLRRMEEAKPNADDSLSRIEASIDDRLGVAQDQTEAFRWFRGAPRDGTPDVVDKRTHHFAGFGGLEKNASEAAAWYRRGAEENDPAAMMFLGILLAEDRPGLPKDTETAAYWLRRAHDLGELAATAWLASLHETGAAGVVQSVGEARRLFTLAAEGGVAWAKERLGKLPAAKATEVPPPPATSYDKRFESLNALRGLSPVKTKLRDFADTMDFARRRRALGHRTALPTAHMLFLGNPGTGKTTVARILGELLRSIGVLTRGHVVEVDRAKLVQVHIGETEKKTSEFIEEAMGGVLFVDEAYTLAPKDSPRDFGPKAIETILTAMENQRDQFVVIFAGYQKEMQNLLDVNPGLVSRVPHHIVFPDYEVADLTAIAMDFISNSHGFGWEAGVQGRVRSLIEDRFVPTPANFANARSVRNLVDEIIGRRAKRQGGNLSRLAVEDIPAVAPKAIRPDPLKELQGMIGLQEAKQQVQQWATRLILAKRRRDQGHPVEARASHMIFAGAPGTGKTVVARLIARILVENGMLRRDVVVEKGRADLVGQYQGQTAPKVQQAFEDADGGVLFIDEAYTLFRTAGDSFGLEAIDALVPLVENKRDRVVVILAGYGPEMDRFLDANPGLTSRFPIRINFTDYTPQEMTLIFEKFLFDKGFHLGKGARERAEHVLGLRSSTRDFGNARGVRNTVDLTLSRMDERLMQGDGSEDLMEVQAQDIPE